MGEREGKALLSVGGVGGMWGWVKVRHCSQWGGGGYVGEREGKALLSVGGWGVCGGGGR